MTMPEMEEKFFAANPDWLFLTGNELTVADLQIYIEMS